MQPIVIKTSAIRTGSGTTVETLDGTAIDCVTNINISIVPNELATAELSVYVGGCDITAHPLLALDSLKEAAAQHGYVLTPKLDNRTAPLNRNMQVRASAPQSPPPPKPKR